MNQPLTDAPRTVVPFALTLATAWLFFLGCTTPRPEAPPAPLDPVAEAAATKALAPNPVPEAVADEPETAGIAPNPVPRPAPTPMDIKAAAKLADLNLSETPATPVEGMSSLTLHSALGRVESTCSSPKKNNSRIVFLVKQWHTAPGVNTVPKVTGRERDLLKGIPQAENQVAIYRILETWVGSGQLRTVLVEGCSQGISRSFESRFNGWNLRALERRSRQPDYASVITHAGLKLEAKFGQGVDTVCADSDELIKAHNLAFSDARGVTGFLSRLEGLNDEDPKAKPYVMSVIDIYRLPPSTSVAQAVAQLQTELKDVIGRIHRGFEERNKVMVRRITSGPARPMALVVGGAHVPDLKARLEKEGVACTVIEPAGYRSEDDELLGRLMKFGN